MGVNLINIVLVSNFAQNLVCQFGADLLSYFMILLFELVFREGCPKDWLLPMQGY